MVMDRPIPSHITGLYVFTVLNLVAMLNVCLVGGDVSVLDVRQNVTLTYYNDMEAEFGAPIPEEGIVGRLVYVTPHNACFPVSSPPQPGKGEILFPWIALVAREDCDFVLKVLNAQTARFDLVIVHNLEGDDELVRMGGGSQHLPIEIPAVFVGYKDGMQLYQQYSYNNTDILIKIDSNITPIDYKLYLWPFAIVIGTCFCLMIVFMIARWCRDIRSKRQARLSKKHLKKIPVKKFKKGDYYDVCAICLDDYEEGEKLRVLPCSHAYHVKCIDPWLLKNKKTCPVCKRRVIPGQDADSETDSEEENGSTPSPSESTPLLADQNRSGPSRRSTFDTSGLPEAVRAEATQNSRAQDESDSGSEEGAVGGVEHESIEVIVESENAAIVNTNFGYSSDEDIVVCNDKGKGRPKKMNQVV